MSNKLERFEYLARMGFDNTTDEQAELRYYFNSLESTASRIAALEAQIAEAREILRFVCLEDMQIMENGYQAEEMADGWLSKYPEVAQ